MIRYVLVLLVFTFPAVAGERGLIMSWSENPKDLLWDLYASVFKRPDRLSAHHQRMYNAVRDLTFTDRISLVDTLIYLDRYGKEVDRIPRHVGHMLPAFDPDEVLEMVSRDEIPHYDDQETTQHILDLYLETNGVTHDVYSLTPKDKAAFASFLTIADRFDGRLDTILRAPDLEELYDLVMIKNIPLAAVGYNCRIEGTWVDRRALIGIDEKRLPKSVRKIMASDMSAGKKLKKLAKALRKHLEPQTDAYGADLWQTSEETLLLGNGDCEDFSILFQSVAEMMGISTEIAVGYIQVTSEDGPSSPTGHAWVVYNGQVIDPLYKDIDHIVYTPKIRMTSSWADFEDSLSVRKPTDHKLVGN